MSARAANTVPSGYVSRYILGYNGEIMDSSAVFEGFEPALKGLVRSRFSEPTEIQRQVIPHVLAGRNALVISETGSGKTESVLLPIFDLWVREKAKADAAGAGGGAARRGRSSGSPRPWARQRSWRSGSAGALLRSRW